MTEGRWGRWAGITLAVLFVAVFAVLNGRERTSLSLGFVVFYQVPLAVLVFLSFLLGMGTMFLVGLRHDLRVRRYLQQRRPTEEPWHVPDEPEPPPPEHFP